MNTAEATQNTLSTRWNAYRAEHPRARIYDAAIALEVSEMELLATDCGETATRLNGPCGDILKALEKAGPIMALTRNHWAVIEKKGQYSPVSFHGPMGLVLDEGIDLRLFMTTWTNAFAVYHPSHPHYSYSIQFFDGSGSALHKVYLPPEASGAWQDIVAQFKSDDQSKEAEVSPASPAPAITPDEDVDREGLLEAWGALKDTHDFHGMLKKFGVARTQAIRMAEGTFTRRLPVSTHRTIFETAAQDELPIMVFVGNNGCIEIHTGPIEKVLEARGWYNIMDPDFNLHLREEGIHETWLVRKPTEDGVVTSVELYDETGKEIAQIFGKRKPGIPELDAWRTLAESLPGL